MAVYLTTLGVDVPAERVWAVPTDFDRYPEWNNFGSGRLFAGHRNVAKERAEERRR